MGNRIKISLVIVVFAVLMPAFAAAQEQRVRLSSREISVRDALRQIEEQTPYRFALGHSNFNMSRTVALPAAEDSVRTILDGLLAGTNRTYRMGSDNQILLVPVRMEPAEEKRMVVVRFDWSKSYGDADFLRDVQEARRYNAPETTPQAPPQVFTEVTLVPDSVFRYSPALVSRDIAADDFWLADGNAPNHFALKTNVLYGVAALAANLSAEIGVGKKTSFEMAYGLNNWNKYTDSNRKKIHYYIRPEFRYWTCNRFDGHFFGLHGFYWQYNVSRHNVPGMFEKEYQYEGDAWGFGLTYGYHLPLSRNWGVEFSAGLGLAFMNFDKYECHRCGDPLGNFDKTYFGLTGFAVKIVYLIK